MLGEFPFNSLGLNITDKENYPILPLLDILDTDEIISHMPSGQWELPQAPYTMIDKIEPHGLDFIKEHKITHFHQFCREVLSKWVPFLDSVEKGYIQADKFLYEGFLPTDVEAAENCKYFYLALRPKLKEGNTEKRKQEILRMIDSSRGAFLYLLTEEQIKELGHTKPERVSDEDIDNAKYLVRRLGTMFCIL